MGMQKYFVGAEENKPIETSLRNNGYAVRIAENHV